MRTLALLLLFLAATAASARPPADDTDLARALDRAVQKATLGQFWGAAVVVKDGRALLARGYGLAGDSLQPITADSLFDLASASKQFTAAAILRLDAQNKLSLDDPVSRFFPGLGERADRVTLRHLLTHTSGMSDESALQRLDFPDRDEAVRLAFASRFTAEPGRRFAYCNAGYIVLAAVAEVASGLPFQQLMREQVFLPAGMTDTAFIDGEGLDPARQTARIVGTWHAPTRTATLFDEPWGWGLRGAGGVATTLNDLVKWHLALAGDAILSDEAKRTLFTPDPASGDASYALGWFISHTDRGTRKATHGGATRGYRCTLTRYLDEDILVAVITNESGNPMQIENVLTEVLFPTPRISATLSIVGLPLNRHSAAQLDNAARWTVAPAQQDGYIALTLDRTDGTGPLASLLIPHSIARGLAKQLDALAQRAAPNAAPGSTVLIGTLGSTPDADGTIRLPDHISWMVMPGYAGMSESGERIDDRRPTFVLVDAQRGFWPLIVRMDSTIAADLASRLEKAAR